MYCISFITLWVHNIKLMFFPCWYNILNIWNRVIHASFHEAGWDAVRKEKMLKNIYTIIFIVEPCRYKHCSYADDSLKSFHLKSFHRKSCRCVKCDLTYFFMICLNINVGTMVIVTVLSPWPIISLISLS